MPLEEYAPHLGSGSADSERSLKDNIRAGRPSTFDEVHLD